MNWRYLITIPVIILVSLGPTFGGDCAALFDRGHSKVEVTLLSHEYDPIQESGFKPDRRFAGELRALDWSGSGTIMALEVDIGYGPVHFRLPLSNKRLSDLKRKLLENHFSGPINLIQIPIESISRERIKAEITRTIGEFSQDHPYYMYATLSKETAIVWLCGYEHSLERFNANPLFAYSIPGIEPRWVHLRINEQAFIVDSGQNEWFYFLPLSKQNVENSPGGNQVESRDGYPRPDHIIVGARRLGVIRRDLQYPLEMELLEHRPPTEEKVGIIRLRSEDKLPSYNRITLFYRGELGAPSFKVLSAEFLPSRNIPGSVRVESEVDGKERLTVYTVVEEGLVNMTLNISDKGAIEKLNPSHVEPYLNLGLFIGWEMEEPGRAEEWSDLPAEGVPVLSGR